MATPKGRRRMRIRVPKTAKRGEVINIKAMIQHPMITGLRLEEFRTGIERHIINRIQVIYGGKVVFDGDLGTGIAADPYFSLYLRAEKSGPVEFRWFDDDGSIYRKSALLSVN